MASIPSKPDDRVLRFVKFYGERIQGRAEDQIARDLDFGSPAALYQKLSQDGFPVCPVCGETPASPNHCAKFKGRRKRRARRGTGQAIELPPAKEAENLFSKAISNMERDLLPLDSRKEVYRDERFETISNYPNASASFYRDTFPPGEEGDEEWRKLCEMYDQDPNLDTFFAANAPTFLPEGATKSPPSPLTELIALYILANEPLAPLLDVLHPNPAEVQPERLDQAVEELWHKAGQLATLVRGGIIRRGPSTEEITPREQNLARFISNKLLQGVSEAEIRELLKKRGISQAEFTRLKNLKLGPFP